MGGREGPEARSVRERMLDGVTRQQWANAGAFHNGRGHGRQIRLRKRMKPGADEGLSDCRATPKHRRLLGGVLT